MLTDRHKNSLFMQDMYGKNFLKDENSNLPIKALYKFLRRLGLDTLDFDSASYEIGLTADYFVICVAGDYSSLLVLNWFQLALYTQTPPQFTCSWYINDASLHKMIATVIGSRPWEFSENLKLDGLFGE